MKYKTNTIQVTEIEDTLMVSTDNYDTLMNFILTRNYELVDVFGTKPEDVSTEINYWNVEFKKHKK